MNQPDQGEQLADFIPLQGADHVPAYFLGHIAFLSRPPGPQLVQSGEIFLDLSGALNEVLHAVLAEVEMAQFDEIADLIE